MGTAAGMLSASRSSLGMGETPPGSNVNRLTAWYAGRHGTEYTYSAWCDIAVAAASDASGNTDACCGEHAWTVEHANAFAAAGRWHYGLPGARPGDVVFFDWSGSRLIRNIDHVGVIEAVRADGTIVTLEGNTDDMFLRRVRNSSFVVGYGRPSYDDAAPMPPTDGILRTGSSGTAVRLLQQRLNQAGANLAVDGQFGPATEDAVRSMQRRAGIVADGEYGPASAAALDSILTGRTVGANLPVDGVIGPQTVAALQRSLNRMGANLTVDGQYGPLTIRALQQHLGVAVDGLVGPQTARALQARVGAAVDGVWGHGTTRALQAVLNLGGTW